MSTFEIGAKVRIKATDTMGTIDAMFKDVSGIQWRVEYVDSTGAIHQIFVHESRLEIA